MQLGDLSQVSQLVSSRAGSAPSPRPPAHVWASVEGQGVWLAQIRVDVDPFGEEAGGTGEREGLGRGRQGMRSESQEGVMPRRAGLLGLEGRTFTVYAGALSKAWSMEGSGM